MAVHLDSCVIIYLHEGPQDLREHIRTRLSRRGGRAVRPCVSELSRIECRVGPLRARDDELLDVYDAFFALPDVKLVDFARPVFDRATALRAEYGFRTPDALHLAAAIEHGCAEFWTNDLRLERKRLPIQVVAVPEPLSTK